MAGPITLTPQLWAKTAAARKPGASYKTYLKYIATARRPQPSVQAGNVMSVFAAGLGPAQQAAAQASVKAQIDASIAAETAASQAAQKQSDAQAQRAQGFALALGGLSNNDATATQDAYSRAAQQVQGFGTGLTGALQSAQQAQADQTKAQVDKMTGGLGSVPGYDLQSLHDVLQYGHTTLPATGLAGAGAAAETTARAQSELGASNVESLAQQYLAKTSDLQNQLLAKKADIQASRPQLMQSSLSSISDAYRQQRALDVQVGTLQLQQAKTVQDQAIAMTNLTGSLHVVRNGKVVDTRTLAPGSTAATSVARTAGENARAAADRRVRLEIAKASNATRLTVAQTQAAARKAAAQVAQQNKTNKPATPSQRSSIIKNSSAQGGDLVKTTIGRIWSLMPPNLTAAQGANESDGAYAQRHAQAVTMFKARQHEHRIQIVNRVARLITPQLNLLKYGPDQINAMANAIVSTYIPRISGQ